MKKAIKKRLLTLVGASTLLLTGAEVVAQDSFVGTLQSHYLSKSYSEYSGVSGKVKGLYGYLGYGLHSLEVELDQFSVNNNDVTKQDDIVAVYSNYQLPGWQLKAGVHSADMALQTWLEADAENDGQWLIEEEQLTAVILGAQYSLYNKGYKVQEFGLDIIQANLDQQTDHDFVQISPSYGHYFSSPILGHYIYASVSLHSQFFKEAINGEDRYFSPELLLKYATLSTSYSLSSQFGDNVNQFALGGFVYRGDNLTHTRQYNLAIAHSFSKSFYASVSLKRQSYLTASNQDEHINIYQLSLGYRF